MVGTTLKTTTDASGRFKFDAVSVGRHVLSLRKSGYQPAVSEPIAVGGGHHCCHAVDAAGHEATLRSLPSPRRVPATRCSNRVPSPRPSTPSSWSARGLCASPMPCARCPASTTVSPVTPQRSADDVNLNIRGIGTLETEAAIDGHPIGYGVKGGYNYNLSPAYGLRNTTVMYGSAERPSRRRRHRGRRSTSKRSILRRPFKPHSRKATVRFNSSQRACALPAKSDTSDLPPRMAWDISTDLSVTRLSIRPGAAFDQSALTGPVHRARRLYRRRRHLNASRPRKAPLQLSAMPTIYSTRCIRPRAGSNKTDQRRRGLPSL